MIPIHDDNPTEIQPVVTITLIVMCCFVFIWQLTLGIDGIGASYYEFGMIPSVVMGTEVLPVDLSRVPAWTTLMTSMFMHGGLMHLGGNMLYLWVFGNNIEDAMGHIRFIVFYLVCGIGASFGQIMLDPASMTPVVGASGAVSGVLAAYLLLYPTARIKLFLPIIFIYIFHLRAVWVLIMWFGLQLVGSALAPAEDSGGGTAYGAHIGGFIAGLLLVGLFKSQSLRLHNPLIALLPRKSPDQQRTASGAPSAALESADITASGPRMDSRPTSTTPRAKSSDTATPGRRGIDGELDADDLDDLAQDRDRLSSLE